MSTRPPARLPSLLDRLAPSDVADVAGPRFRAELAASRPDAGGVDLVRAADAALAPFRHLPVAACVTGWRDGRVVDANDAFALLVDARPEAFLGRASEAFLELLEPVSLEAALAEAAAHGRAHYARATYRDRQGRRRRGSVTLTPVAAEDRTGLLTVVVDATSLHEAERARRFADTRYELLARHARDLVTLHDAAGTILWASGSARDVLGHEPDRLEGMPMLALVHPEDRAQARLALRAVADEEPAFRATLRVRGSDGGWRWLEVLGSPVDAAAPVRGASLLLSSRDVTARVEAQARAERLARSEARARREADAERRLLDAVIERAPSLIALLKGPELVLERANAAFLGACPEPGAALGRPLHELVRSGEGRRLVVEAERVMAGGEAATGRLLLRTPSSPPGGAADGDEVRHVEYRIQPVRDEGAGTERVSLHGIDVTAAARAHDALARSERDYRTLASFGFEMLRAADAPELFRIGLEGLSALIEADYSALFDHAGAELRLRSIVGAFPDDVEPGIRRPQPAHVGLLGKAVALRETVFVPDYARDPNHDPAFDGTSLRGLLAVPIEQGGVVRHVMVFGSVRPTWTLDDARLDVVASFARRLEVALEAGAHLRDIEETREETFRVLGLALEHRDYETHGHTDRVVRLARRFAGRLGLSAAERQELAWGAYLHDVGKLSISDVILHKPGRLTPAEFAEVERHTIIGEDIARGLAFLPPGALQVVRSHHERWDGGGYPDGLAGTAIPRPARIFALVDVYDALTSERPYKRAWTPEAACREIAREAGVRFDPELARVFLQVVEEGALSPAAAGPP